MLKGAIRKSVHDHIMRGREILLQIISSKENRGVTFGKKINMRHPTRNVLNVNGSSISLEHPMGATGSRLVVTLIHEVIARDVNLGLASYVPAVE